MNDHRQRLSNEFGNRRAVNAVIMETPGHMLPGLEKTAARTADHMKYKEIEHRLTTILSEHAKLNDKRKDTSIVRFQKRAEYGYRIKFCIERFFEEVENIKKPGETSDSAANQSIWEYLLKSNKAHVYWGDAGGTQDKMKDLKAVYDTYSDDLKAIQGKISSQLKAVFKDLRINEIYYDLLNVAALMQLNFKGLINLDMPDISIELNITFPTLKIPPFTIPAFPNFEDFINQLKVTLPDIDLKLLTNLVKYIYILKNITIKLPEFNLPGLVAIDLPQLKVPALLPDVKLPNIPPVGPIKDMLIDFISDLVVSVPLFPLGVIKNARRLYNNGKKAYKAYKSSKRAHLANFEKKQTSKLHIVLSDSIEGAYMTRCKEHSAKFARSAIELATLPLPGSTPFAAGMSIAAYGYATYRFCADWNDFRVLRSLLNPAPDAAGSPPGYPDLKKFVTYPALSCCVLTELDEAMFVNAILPNDKAGKKNNVIIAEMDSIIAQTIRDISISEDSRKEISEQIFKIWFGTLKEEATALQEKMPYYVSTKPKSGNVYEIVKANVEDQIKGQLFDSGTESLIEQIKDKDENAADLLEEYIEIVTDEGKEDISVLISQEDGK